MELVVGSNLTALLMAIALKKYDRNKNVALANFGPKFGGNSQSFKFKNQSIDLGMQTFYECGVVWADKLVKEALTDVTISVVFEKKSTDSGLPKTDVARAWFTS